jgi:signal transduction histidine kinase
MKARVRYSYLVVTGTLVVTLGVPLVTLYAHTSYARLTGDAWLAADAKAHLAAHAIEQDDREGLAAIAAFRTLRTGRSVAIFDAAGEVLTTSRSTGLRGAPPPTLEHHPDVAAVLAGEPPGEQATAFESHPGWLSVAVPIESNGVLLGAVDLAVPTAAVDTRIWAVRWGAVGIGLAALALVWVLGGQLGGWVLRPLRKLESATASWADGNHSARARIDSGPTEVQDVGRTFDAMAERLEMLVQAQATFVADACHELRLPLTVFRLRLANLAHRVDEEAGADLLTLDSDVGALAGRLDELLLLASAEGRARTYEAVEVSAVTESRAAFWRPLARARGVTIGTHIPAEIVGLQARELRGVLAQILDNLMSNALYASPPLGEVVLTIERAGDALEIHVIDGGGGLDEEARAHAFDRFWRASARADRGGGLGLAIVRRLAAAMDATVELRAAAGEGTDAVIRLRPVDPDRPVPEAGPTPNASPARRVDSST